MIPAIRTQLEKLERQKQTMLSNAAQLTLRQQHFRPAATAWSSLNLLDHLMKVESGFLQGVRGQLPKGAPLRFSDRIGALLVITVMLSPMRVKVPPAAAISLPEQDPDLSLIGPAWARVREQMADLLESLEPEQLNIGLFRHPVGGWMPIQTGLAFLSAHLRHHRYQLRRLQSASLKA
ncbi:MAG: DinB family protein [Acidobacteriaceae bacterium]|nr:DinB family protein [Acidobacteriaceae bacterium]